MTKNEARKLATVIAHSEEQCRVAGYRRYARGSWALDILDMATGWSFVVAREEDWWDRLADKADREGQ